MTIITLNLLIGAIALVLTILFGLAIQKHESVIAWVYAYFRNFLGTFFIFSGVVKAIDPTGTGIKNNDYFGVFSEYLPSLDFLWNFAGNFTLEIAMIIIILEIIIGVTLILGLFKKPTLWLYAGLLIFFTFLTGFTTLTGKVTDCGCFGDFLVLKPKVSFFKDIFLSAILIFVIIFSAKHLKPIFNKVIGYPFLIAATLFTVWFTVRNVNHLPIKDFRAYSIGTDLNKCTSTDGLEKGEKLIYYTMVNGKTKATKEIESKEYMSSGIWKDKNWQIDSDRNREVILTEAELPPCKDFIILDGNSNEIQEDVKNQTGIMFFVAAYDLDKSDGSGFQRINNVMTKVNKAGFPIYGLTASNIERGNKKARGFTFFNLDAVPIKTMIRSNPGVVMMEDGVIKAKWHYNDLPTFDQIKKEFKF